jgi:hypothetical protein
MTSARIAAAALILMSMSAAASAKEVTLGGETNLRKGAGTNTEVVTLIPKGEKVEVGKCTNGWCEVTYNGQQGFVIARNVGMVAPGGPGGPPHGMVRRYGPPPGGPRGPAYAGDDYEVVGPPVAYGPGYVVSPGAYYYGYPYRPYYYGPGPYWGWRRPWRYY